MIALPRMPHVFSRALRLIVILSLAALAAHGQQPVSTGAETEAPAEDPFPSFHILGFTDFNYSEVSQATGHTSGFAEGQFVLHFTSVMTERFTFFAEVSNTARLDANTSSAVSSFRTEIERAILKYQHSDLLKISAGRYHTPISYWNAAFHHGQWLQTTVSRPEMIRFGGEFLPVHFVGLSVEGLHPAGGVNVGYNAGIGNGRSGVIGRAGDAGDVNDSRAVSAGLTAKPDRLFGLRMGASAYSDRITTATVRYNELITSAHAVWERESPEIITEVARVRHRPDDGGPDATSTGWYVQAAYRLPVWNSKWKPYARWERLRVDENDVAFRSVAPVRLLTAGIRWDVAQVVALKAEYRDNDLETPYRRGWFAQVSFSF